MSKKTRNTIALLSFVIFLGGIMTAQAFTPTEPKEPMAFAKGKSYVAIIKTNKGDIECALNHKEAPLSVTNFIQLANGDFYKGLKFHRYVENFVIQGGDPEGTGAGGPGYTVKGETTNGLKHNTGALAWARTSDKINPERRSSGSQFYITLQQTPHLDGKYTVFGYVEKGMDVVLSLRQDDTILDIVIEER